MRKVLYTAIFGNHDKLKEPVVTNGWEYILFTNNRELKSDIWDIRYVDCLKMEMTNKDGVKLIVDDLAKSARNVKINYHN